MVTYVVRFKYDLFECRFMVAGEHGNTFPTHNIKHLPGLVAGRSSLLLPLVKNEQYEPHVVDAPIYIENCIIMTRHSNMLRHKPSLTSKRSIQKPYISILIRNRSQSIGYRQFLASGQYYCNI